MGERSFCSLLERFIRESGHTNFSFAKATGINRVNIQRYVSGGRVPSRPVFEQIRANLNLNRQEQRTFTEQYLLAFYGEDFYFQRKAIREILERTADMSAVEPELTEKNGEASPAVSTIRGRVAVERFVWSRLCEALKTEPEVHACVYIPAEACELNRLVPAADPEGNPAGGRLKIVQLVQLVKRADAVGFRYHNLRVLNNLMPYYFQAGSDYETYFYYHNYPVMDGNNGLLYPYYVIFEGAVILLSADLEKAVSISGREAEQRFREDFMERLSGAEPFAKYYSTAEEMLAHVLRIDNQAGERCFLEYQPCFAVWAGRELVEQVVAQGIPRREELIEGFMKRTRQLADGSRFFHYFTEEGIWEFVRTGICADYPREYTRPLTVKERLAILEQIRASVEKEEGELGIVDSKNLMLTKRLNVFASGGCGLNLILYDERLGYRYLLIRENSLCRAFAEYIESMRENGDVCSKERNLEILEECIASLKAELAADAKVPDANVFETKVSEAKTFETKASENGR